MVFLLESKNVVQYLIENRIGNVQEGQSPNLIESKICKNFNLLVHFSDNCQLLVKQEPHDQQGQTNGDLQNEWQVCELIRNFPELNHLCQCISDAVHFDPNHSILVFNYLTDYYDLDEFYTQHHTFPTAIAAALGVTLAEIHRATLDHWDYRAFLERMDDIETEQVPDFSYGLEQITPEVFGVTSADGLKFYELYQRDESLGRAIAHLNTVYEPCCLAHNDLKLNNILLRIRWEEILSRIPYDSALTWKIGDTSIIRLIDWEKWTWGDPALDMGTVIASYLKLWLKSLIVNQDIEIELALHLAATPLEQVQPSLIALVQAYCAHIPDILPRFPDFLTRVMQFAGLALIESIQAKLHYYEPFGNTGICMLQVAKTLLCHPEQSLPMVFGLTAAELLDLNHKQSIKIEQHSIPTTPKSDQTVRSLSSMNAPLQLLPNHRNGQSFAPDGDLLLWDIACNVQIQPDYSITHPSYKSLERPEEIGRFQQLAKDLQHNYLRHQLRNYLYDIYFSGEQESMTSDANLGSLQNLKNNTLRGVDLEFYERLHTNNSGNGYYDPGWRVLQHKKNGRVVVQKEGLTLHIEPSRHLPLNTKLPNAGEVVAIHLPRNRIESELYVAVGNAGLVPYNLPAVEIYLNVTPEGAIALMESLTQHLNAIHIHFTLKVLVDPNDYGRYDAGILRVERCHYKAIQQVLELVYTEGRSHFHPGVPLFTKRLAPGLGLAEAPETAPKDFGLNRCQLIADALLVAWEQGNASPDARMDILAQHFTQHGIDLQRPYLNLNTEDIYIPLPYAPSICP